MHVKVISKIMALWFNGTLWLTTQKGQECDTANIGLITKGDYMCTVYSIYKHITYQLVLAQNISL